MQPVPALPRTLDTPLPNGTMVMLAVVRNEEFTGDAPSAGTPGYLLSGHDPQALLAAITEVTRGGAPRSSGIAREVTVSMRMGPQARTGPRLSPRETEVLRCLVDGLSYKMVADRLDIGFETVRSHIKRIYGKLRVHNNTEAVAKALKIGLVA